MNNIVIKISYHIHTSQYQPILDIE